MALDYDEAWRQATAYIDAFNRLVLEFKSAGNALLDWGYIKGGRQRPYKIELLQPNGAVEGGNGSHS